MLNMKLVYELFKNIENAVNNTDYFAVYHFDDFIDDMMDSYDDNFDCGDDEIDDACKTINMLYHDFHCTNDNTLVFMANCDDDEYLIINYEYDHRIVTQNLDIEYIDTNGAYMVLDSIFREIAINEYV